MNTEIRILVVDDEVDFVDLLSSRLTRKGYKVLQAYDGMTALELIQKETVHLVLLDLKMPRMDGIAFLQESKQLVPALQVIVVTGHGTIETAIEAMKLGAYDYLTKPYNMKELEALISKSLEKQQLEEENEQLKKIISSKGNSTAIIAESPAMKRVIATCEQIAQTDSPVLLSGESGTGKEVMAHLIYETSLRRNQPLVPINMGAIPETMVESELFGHEKGAFTGAIAQKKGLVEIAHNGTLFLDEIGDFPYLLQVKLLRFLETGEFRRVGSNILQKVDVRVITATNSDLEKLVEEGKFRADLYYRLHVVDIEIPPLRQRKEDISPLTEYFLARFQRNQKGRTLTPAASSAMQQYAYPGNVRELGHLIERGVILSTGEQIDITDLFPLQAQTTYNVVTQAVDLYPITNGSSAFSLKEVEKQYIHQVLELKEWNKTKAAEQLGISVRNLYRKIEEYDLRP